MTIETSTDIAARFESATTEEMLVWALARFPRLVMTSSFGAEGIVLIDLLARVAPERLRALPIVYLDTGFHFSETERLKEQVQRRYDLNLIEQRAELTVAQQARTHGDRLFESDPDLCCRLRKVAPLAAALGGYDGWLAALRRDQSPTRVNLGLVEWNARHGLVKLNPLARWTRAEVWNYTLKHRLPYNQLYDEGYASIGCAPCTRRVNVGEHERGGRWAGHGKLECGIHL